VNAISHRIRDFRAFVETLHPTPILSPISQGQQLGLERILGAGVGRKPYCRAGGSPGSVLVWKARLSEDDIPLQHRELKEALSSAMWEPKGSEVDLRQGFFVS
jgi:hypothetical protein